MNHARVLFERMQHLRVTAGEHGWAQIQPTPVGSATSEFDYVTMLLSWYPSISESRPNLYIISVLCLHLYR